jgi:hypothetical protein
MQRGHCEEGSKLYVRYKKSSMELLGLETHKRYTICEATRSEWLEISRGVEIARAAYEEARTKYADHKSACDQCDHDVAIFRLLKGSSERGPKTTAQNASHDGCLSFSAPGYT